MSSGQHPQTAHRQVPSWAHLCAWLLASATFALIVAGGIVTTTDSGMAFRDWMTSDGTFFLIYDWFGSTGDKFIEHGHRLLGSLAGFLAIVLVAVTFRCEHRPWVKRLSLLILAGVILQGLLGGARVVFDQRTLALIHGCTGPLFFALTVSMVVFTSRWWREVEPVRPAAGETLPQAGCRDNVFRVKTCRDRTFRWAVVSACLAYLQLVVGAVVRHSPSMTAASSATVFQVAVYFHLFLAMLILAQVSLLAGRCLKSGLQSSTGCCLLALIGTQILLGLSAWLVKYGLPLWATQLWGELTFVNHKADLTSSAIVTGHMAVGSLILVVATALALRLGRQLRVAVPCWSSGKTLAAEGVR